LVGAPAPVAVITPVPVLVTLPVTVALLKISIQVMAAALVTAADVPPLCDWQDAANVADAPPATIIAATELDANNRRIRGLTRRVLEVRPIANFRAVPRRHDFLIEL
jgi:hypothetical protein